MHYYAEIIEKKTILYLNSKSKSKASEALFRRKKQNINEYSLYFLLSSNTQQTFYY